MADMDVDVPEPKGKEVGKDSSKKRFEVKKVRTRRWRRRSLIRFVAHTAYLTNCCVLVERCSTMGVG